MIKQVSKTLKKSFNKLLKPKGKVSFKDIATLILAIIVASLAVNIIMTAFRLFCLSWSLSKFTRCKA